NGQPSFQTGANGILTPGAVALIDLPNGNKDLVVANSGANEILLYPGETTNGVFNGTFGSPTAYDTGEDPVGITIANLTASGIPDVIVANEGSNDISTFLGQLDAEGNYTLQAPSRTPSHGYGPVSTVVAPVLNAQGQPTFDASGNPVVNLLVAYSNSSQVAEIPGTGQGTFSANAFSTFNTGLDPVQVLTANLDGTLDLITVN